MPTGVYEHTEDHNRKISEAHKGKSLFERGHKSNCQCSCCKIKRGEFKHSEKTKQKMRELRKGKFLPEKGHKSNCLCCFCKAKRGEIKGKNHFNWKGGQIIHKGYVFVLMSDHPKTNGKGYVRKSHLVAEEMLGRYLYPEEITHHKNGIKDDDRSENIEVMESNSFHIKYHRQIKKSTRRNQ